MKAIVDCNSFYCSCERLFNPHLKKKPVVVLSNNDGCIISISDEAKKLGVSMASPYFLAKPIIEKYGIATFSSNYNLYGDLSRRVMETLCTLLPRNSVEVYSVDEAFLDLSHISPHQLEATAMHIRNTVELWTGISVSVGVAPTKTLAKMANRIAKKNKIATSCVMVLNTEEKISAALRQTKVGDIWGVGGRSVIKLEQIGINDAWQLKQLPEEWARQHLGGVVGVRLLKELRGEPSIEMDDPLTDKKMIATTRMFGQPVTALSDIKEAVATYTSRAAEKLRRQHSAATHLYVFVVPQQKKEEGRFRHGPTVGSQYAMQVATSSTNELIKPAMAMVEQLFEHGRLYKKAGVILSGLVPDDTIQANLFEPVKNDMRQLMNVIDNVNFSMRDDVLKFATAGTKKNWKMRQDYRSPRYTSRWTEMKEIV